jgi:hypothetical protein
MPVLKNGYRPKGQVTVQVEGQKERQKIRILGCFLFKDTALGLSSPNNFIKYRKSYIVRYSSKICS